MSVFFRFGAVGVVGFVIDATTLALMLWLGTGFYGGRACSYVAAASCTWMLNRAWTFRARGGRRAQQLAQFLAVNTIGGGINYGVYSLIVSYFHGASIAIPILGVAVGSIFGLVVNFTLSKRLVFHRTKNIFV